MKSTIMTTIVFVLVSFILFASSNSYTETKAQDEKETEVLISTEERAVSSNFEKSLDNEQPFLLANHSSDGVLTRRFENMGRCSSICPRMRKIAAAHCKSMGECWCDEKSGGVTIGHIVCK